MWNAERRRVENGAGEILSIAEDAKVLTVAEAIARWRDDAAFRDFFIAALAASDDAAFFWEMPPLEADTLSDPFACALIRGDALARMRASDRDFAEHLAEVDAIAVFPNLGGDALLIAPKRIGDADCYGHFAAFLRGAPREQQHALLRCLSLEIERRLATARDRFWVSTSGLGVPWVHVRLDERPKYFQFGPYR
jgi:hypothetical protein